MSVDLEAIAQRGRCDVSSLRLAIPLLEQGYSPPFLARYRRDELGGLDESSLWALSTAMQTEQQVQRRRDELFEAWQKTSPSDPAIGNAIKKSNSLRMLNRLGRRLKHEAGDASDDATRLAVRILNPHKGDDDELSAIAASVEGIQDVDAAVAGVDQALAKRLAGDPRMVAAAVRWLAKNAKIQIASIHDPHLAADDESAADSAVEAPKAVKEAASQPAATTTEASSPAADAPPPTTLDAATVDAATVDAAAVEAATAEAATEDAAAPLTTSTEAASTEAASPEAASPEATSPEATSPEAATAEASIGVTESAAPTGPGEATPAMTEPTAEAASVGDGGSATETAQETKPSGKGKRKSKASATKQTGKKQKKISPRQRRRRWLVGVLKPLEGKRFASDKLSAFQIVMLGRALRSQVAQCSFEYDATKLVGELQRTAGSINRNFEPQLRQIVLDHEADIREAAEAAWWDDLHEKASSRLVTITADHLRRHINRGAVEAKVVMAIDAVGPRTAATSIVCADGRILHNEDLPCQLSASLRSQAVARMGELIHSFHVDLIVISNGPARRATMIALGDLISQSPDKSVRWTLADRSGADVYAGSSVADEEMRSTPRRFRAAAWLAFSVLQPAQALAKIDPLKLRLSSFQRELSDDAMSDALEDVMVSGASRGGVDVNSAPVSWLVRLPGVTSEVARAIDEARRNALFPSRTAVGELAEWSSVAGSRQALPFLRVFGSDEVLDGTLIHPDDYALAKKLAGALGIELPPQSPPGYEPPDFSEPQDPTAKVKIAEAPTQAKPSVVEDFSSAGDRAKEFSIEEAASAAAVEETETAQAENASGEAVSDVQAVPHAEQNADDNPDQVADSASSDAEASADAAEAATSDETPTPGEPVAAEGESSQGDGDSSGSEQAEVPKATAIAREDIPEPIRRPRPERAKVEKCVKEWQIGARRAHQLVQWLCDPFGDSDFSGSAPAVLTTLPSSKALKEGDMVIGVVVGVMPFGVFVELAPDCSGLVHVSRVSDSYVEDLHEAVQVGDVITAWVTGIDEKRRRVALTAISPEREAEIEEARRARDHRSHQSGPRRGGGGRDRGPARTGAARSGAGTAAPAAGVSGGQPRGGQGRADQARGGSGRSSGRDSQARGDSQGRGGRGVRGGKRQQESRSGGRGREKKPESYRVVSKPESKPITDAMQKGEEPLRSFGDLLQFFGKSTSSKPEQPSPPAKDPSPPADQQASGETPSAPTPNAESISAESISAESISAESISAGAKTPESASDVGGTAHGKRAGNEVGDPSISLTNNAPTSEASTPESSPAEPPSSADTPSP